MFFKIISTSQTFVFLFVLFNAVLTDFPPNNSISLKEQQTKQTIIPINKTTTSTNLPTKDTTIKTSTTTTLTTTTTKPKETTIVKINQKYTKNDNKIQKHLKKSYKKQIAFLAYPPNNGPFSYEQYNNEGDSYEEREQQKHHYNEHDEYPTNKYNNREYRGDYYPYEEHQPYYYNNEYAKSDEYYHEKNYEKPSYGKPYYPEQKNEYNNEENYNNYDKKENVYNEEEYYGQQKQQQTYSGKSPWSFEYNKPHSYDSHYCSVHGSFSLALATTGYNYENNNYEKGDEYNKGYIHQSRYHTRQFCRFAAANSQKACNFCCKIVARSANTSPDDIVSAIFKFVPAYPSANGAGIGGDYYYEKEGEESYKSEYQCVCCAPK